MEASDRNRGDPDVPAGQQRAERATGDEPDGGRHAVDNGNPAAARHYASDTHLNALRPVVLAAPTEGEADHHERRQHGDDGGDAHDDGGARPVEARPHGDFAARPRLVHRRCGHAVLTEARVPPPRAALVVPAVRVQAHAVLRHLRRVAGRRPVLVGLRRRLRPAREAVVAAVVRSRAVGQVGAAGARRVPEPAGVRCLLAVRALVPADIRALVVGVLVVADPNGGQLICAEDIGAALDHRDDERVLVGGADARERALAARRITAHSRAVPVEAECP